MRQEITSHLNLVSYQLVGLLPDTYLEGASIILAG